jgi:flavodoxin
MAKTVIICKSVHHGNTLQVARAIADVLHAEIVAPEDFPYTSLGDADLVGFGSGISYGGMHAALREWVQGLPAAAPDGHRAFLFSTAGLPFLWRTWHRLLRNDLERKGFDVVGEFHCRGFDNWGPLWLAGGINRRHPDARDLDRAADFARRLPVVPARIPARRFAG